jgi:hypothetical protein
MVVEQAARLSLRSRDPRVETEYIVGERPRGGAVPDAALVLLSILAAPLRG